MTDFYGSLIFEKKICCKSKNTFWIAVNCLCFFQKIEPPENLYLLLGIYFIYKTCLLHSMRKVFWNVGFFKNQSNLLQEFSKTFLRISTVISKMTLEFFLNCWRISVSFWCSKIEFSEKTTKTRKKSPFTFDITASTIELHKEADFSNNWESIPKTVIWFFRSEFLKITLSHTALFHQICFTGR